MINNNLQSILIAEASKLRSYVTEIEDLFNKYSAISEIDIGLYKLQDEFPSDYEKYFNYSERVLKRKELSIEFDTKSNALLTSLATINGLLKSNKSLLPRENWNAIDYITKQIILIESNTIFTVGLKGNNGWDSNKRIELFRGVNGLPKIKEIIFRYISPTISNLQFESRNGQTEAKDARMWLKIRDWVLENIIRLAITIVVALIFLFFGIKSILF